MKPFEAWVKADCELLLRRFQTTDSVRFEAFTSIWRELKFEHIFYGAARHENRLFTRILLDAAYVFLLPPFTFQIRVGGLYLLYALFHRQTITPPEKIRLALKDWQQLQSLEKDAVDSQHYDVVYVLKTLLHKKAFVFTAMPRQLQFDRKKQPQLRPVTETFVERPSAPQTLINNTLLEELSNVHDLYSSLKSSVCPQSESGLSLIQADLVQNLTGTVLDYYTWQQHKFPASALSPDEDSGEGPSTQQESSRRAGLLASIKSRAYGETAATSKSRRHRAVEVESATQCSKHSHRVRPKTLKYKVTMNKQVFGEKWKDASSSTQISRLTTHADKHKPPRCYKKFKWNSEEAERPIAPENKN